MEKRKQYDIKVILPRTGEHKIPKAKITYSPAPSDAVDVKIIFD